MTYRPEQRSVHCQVMTTTGWLQGTFHVPKNAIFLDQLNLQRTFFRITDVSFPGKEYQMSFFALRRQSVTLIVPPLYAKDVVRVEGEDLRVNRVTCIFEGGVITGNLWMKPNLRVSDFFAKQTGYFVLHRTRLLLGDFRDDFFVEEEHPVAVVNANGIIGVTEAEFV
jgi:hypothetical protein